MKVQQNNNLANRARNIASEIERKYPEMKITFYQLLFDENLSVRMWAAHHILEVMNYNDELRKNALKEIAFTAENDTGIDGIGNKMWLKSWLSEHPSDIELLQTMGSAACEVRVMGKGE